MRKVSCEDRIEVAILKKEIECLRRELDLVTKRVSDLEYTTDLQKTLINSYESNTATAGKHYDSFKAGTAQQPGLRQYSDIVKTTPKDKSPVLLVKGPTEGSIPDNIIEDLMASASPASINICIHSTHKIKNGVAVHCKDEQSLSLLRDTLNHKFRNKFQVNEAKMLNPRLLIKDIKLKDHGSPESIVSNIITLNDLSDIGSSDIKFVAKLNNKDSVDIVIEVSPATRKILLKLGKLFFGWKRSVVEDYVRVIKCLNCCSFGHKTSECKSELACPRCTGKHKLKECKSSELQCINCLNYNKMHKKSLQTNHSSNHFGCAARKIYTEYLDKSELWLIDQTLLEYAT
nr:unnamed protein product [Callosobruchus analis]